MYYFWALVYVLLLRAGLCITSGRPFMYYFCAPVYVLLLGRPFMYYFWAARLCITSGRSFMYYFCAPVYVLLLGARLCITSGRPFMYYFCAPVYVLLLGARLCITSGLPVYVVLLGARLCITSGRPFMYYFWDDFCVNCGIAKCIIHLTNHVLTRPRNGAAFRATKPKRNTSKCVIKVTEVCRFTVLCNMWHVYKHNNISVCSDVSGEASGGIAQWQSIRLQIERSPVQLWLPPLLFLFS